MQRARADGKDPTKLAEITANPLVESSRARRLAREDLLPLADPFRELLGTPGLRRGSTLVLHATAGRGSFGVGLGLVAEASAHGAWCAAVDLSSLGLLAASEFGVALDRLAVVSSTKGHFADVVGSLLEGFDVVVVGLCASPPASQARRLVAKARKHKAVLVVVPFSFSEGSKTAPVWPESADVELSITGRHFLGLGHGEGRITAHLVEVEAFRRHAVPHVWRSRIWLPSLDGAITAEPLPVGQVADPNEASPMAVGLA